MGMTANFIRVSQQTLNQYLQHPESLREDYFTEDGLIESNAVYDIDKSWDGILFLLTGKNSSDNTEPLSSLIFSNQLIDAQQDLGTGPAHYLLPEQVKTLNDMIRVIDAHSLKAKFNASQMQELGVYPNNVWQEEGVDEYLIEYFETLQELYAIAAEKDEAIISFIQ